MPKRAAAAILLLLAQAAGALFAQAAGAAPLEVVLPGESVYPGSVTSTADGTLFAGSFAAGGVMRALPGAAMAQAWLRPGAGGSRSVFGVMADDVASTLWVCSNDLSGIGIPGPQRAKSSISTLKAFDLQTGRVLGSTPLPDAPAQCNDIAVAANGAVYVTDAFNPHILILKPGASAFEVWATDPRFAPSEGGGGLSGIAVGSDGTVYVAVAKPPALFRIASNGGVAGPVTPLRTDRAILQPGTLRRYGTHNLMLVEGVGKLDLVAVNGDMAAVKTVQDKLDGPTSVTVTGNTAWVAEGQLIKLLDPTLTNQKPRLPFRLFAVPLPADVAPDQMAGSPATGTSPMAVISAVTSATALSQAAGSGPFATSATPPPPPR